MLTPWGAYRNRKRLFFYTDLLQFDADVHAMILLFGKEGERVYVVGHVGRAALRHVYAALVRVLTYAHRRVQPISPAH